MTIDSIDAINRSIELGRTGAAPVEVFDVAAGQGHFCALVEVRTLYYYYYDYYRGNGLTQAIDQSAAPPPGGVVKCWGGGPNVFQCGELGYGDGDRRGVSGCCRGGAGPIPFAARDSALLTTLTLPFAAGLS